MLRLVRSQVRWEKRALNFYLQELAGWRGRNPALTPERLNRFRDDLDRVAGDAIFAERRLARLRKRFEALWMALFDPEAWARLAAHIRDPSGVPNEPTHMAMGLGLLDLLAGGRRGSRSRNRSSGRGGDLGSAGLGDAGLGARASRRGAQGGACPHSDLDADGNLNPEPPKGPPRIALPRSPFARYWDPLKHLCRTCAHGLQDWRLRLDQLTAATLSEPFNSPANVEAAQKRRRAPAKVRERRRSDSASAGSEGAERRRGSRSGSRRARFPGDGLLASLAAIGVLMNVTSLSVLRELLAQGLGDAGEASGRAAAAPEVRESSDELAELAEALWTRLEAWQVLADTLEEMLARMLEYHCPGSALPGTEAPTFDALLKARKGKAAIPAGVRPDDLWIRTEPLDPNTTPLDGLRLWFEAADGVLDAGSHLAQAVDVALYEFAVRRFGVRRDFVAWRAQAFD